MKAELVHDILARKIGQKVSAEDRSRRRKERLVRENYERFQEDRKFGYLSADELQFLDIDSDDFEGGGYDFSEGEIEYLQSSIRKRKQERIFKKTGYAGATALLLFLAGLGLYSGFLYWNADTQKTKIEKDILSVERDTETAEKNIQTAEKDLEEKERELALKEKKLEEESKNEEKGKKESVKLQSELKKIEEEKKETEKRLPKLQEYAKKAELIKNADVQKKQEFFDEMAQDESRWSPAAKNTMNWKDAKEYCEKTLGKGYRLPALAEYKSAYKSTELIRKWREEKDGFYWTNDELSDDFAYEFDISDGLSYYGRKGLDDYVRCIR